MLERHIRLREQLLTDANVELRAARLASLYESEARIWSQLFELSAHRLVWRAALAAEARARSEARRWWRRAVDEAAPEVLAVAGVQAVHPLTQSALEV